MKFYLTIFTLLAYFCFVSSSTAQVTRPVPRGDDTYNELAVLDFKLILEHDSIIEFITREDLCPRWDEENAPLRCRGGDFNGYEIAGLCFLPIWDELNLDENTKTGSFKTGSLRVALVLWKRNSQGNPDEIILAGFGNSSADIPNALEPMQDHYAPYTLDLPFTTTVQIPIPDKINPVADSREFDLVLLTWERYLDLATSTDYYIGQSRQKEGIIVQRTGNIMNESIDDSNNFKHVNYRNLVFWAYDTPATGQGDRANIGFEQGYPCPRAWRDGITSETVRARMSHEMHLLRINPSTYASSRSGTNPKRSIIVNIGTQLPDTPLAINDLNYELGLRFPFRKDYAAETLFGVYQSALETRQYGLNVILKKYFPLSEKFKKWAFQLAGGGGIYNSSQGNNGAGPTVMGGGRYQLGKTQIAALEGNIQYQSISAIGNSSFNSINFFSAKIGFTVSF